MAQRMLLEFVLDSSGNLKAFTEAGKEVEGLGDKTEDAEDKVMSFGEKAMIAAAVVGTLKVAADVAIDLAKLGIQAEATEDRFTAFAGSTAQANAYLAEFDEATDGTVDRMGAMAGASKMLQMGLVDNADEMGTMAAVAVKLGDQTMGAGQRLADFSALLANRSIPRLDNFGISSGKVREKVEQLKKEGYGLDEAFKLAVLEEGTKSLAILGDTAELNATKVARATAMWSSFKVGIGKEFANTAGDAAEALGLINMNMEEIERLGAIVGASIKGAFSNDLMAGARVAKQFAEAERLAGFEAIGWQEDEDELRKSLVKTTEVIETAGRATDGMIAFIMEAETATGNYMVSSEELADALAEQEAAFVRAGRAAADAAENYTTYLQDLTDATTVFARNREDLETTHQAKLVELAEEGNAEKIADEIASYEESLSVLEQNFADAEAAQRQSLGRMLIEHFTAWAQMNGVASGEILKTQLYFMEKYGLMTADGIAMAAEMEAQFAGIKEHGVAMWSDIEDKRARYQANLQAMKGKTIDIRIRTIHETIGSGSPGANIPTLEQQHGGTASGLTLVGERGPEYVMIPPGSRVYNNDNTRSMMHQGRGGGRTQIFNFAPGSVRSAQDIYDIARRIKELEVLGGANRSFVV